MGNLFTSPKIKAGIGERWKEANAGVKGGEPTAAGAVEFVIDWLLAEKEVSIRARFQRIGLPLEDGAITVESLRNLVRAKSGLDLNELTADGIVQAVDSRLAAELSEKLGMSVSSVFNADAAKQEIKAQLLEKLASGEGLAVISGPALRKLRKVATFTRAGFTPEEGVNALNRVYQKRYRRHNREVWD